MERLSYVIEMCESIDNNKKLWDVLKFIEDICESKLLNEENCMILKFLSKSEDAWIRAAIAKNIVVFDAAMVEDILLQLLDDEDEWVRVEACDSLCIGESRECVERLLNLAYDDSSNLVRSYAILSLGDIAFSNQHFSTDVLKEMYQLLKETKTVENRSAIWRTMVLLGEDQYLIEMIQTMKNKNYLVRCTIINYLIDLIEMQVIEKRDLKIILESSLTRLNYERSKAVKSSLKKLNSIIRALISKDNSH